MPESQTAAPPAPAAEPPRLAPRPAGDVGHAGARPPADRAAIVGVAFRTWLRYVVPLTLLSAIALAPLVAIAITTPAPADLAAVKAIVPRGWIALGLAWIGQLLLVGGASVATTRPSQLGALGGGLVQLARAIVPCLVAAAAIAIGSLALVLPGVVLLALLSLTGASRARGLPAPLVDSIAAARRQLPAVALAVAALVAIDAAIGVVAFRALVAPLPARPTAAQLAGARDFVRAVVLGLVVLSPLPATVLAALRDRAR